MHQSHYSACITYETGGISTSYCPTIFLSSAVTQLWHKGPQFQCGGLSAPIPMWGPQCLNFNVGGLNASNFNVGASISMWGRGGLNFNVRASILMWGPQCLNFNVGASVPQIQREASISMWGGASISMYGPQFQCGSLSASNST